MAQQRESEMPDPDQSLHRLSDKELLDRVAFRHSVSAEVISKLVEIYEPCQSAYSQRGLLSKAIEDPGKGFDRFVINIKGVFRMMEQSND